MVAELALYFAGQGCYPAEKGVVILVSDCTYHQFIYTQLI